MIQSHPAKVELERYSLSRRELLAALLGLGTDRLRMTPRG